MRGLLACLLERRITVPHVGSFHVRPPRLVEALRVIAALDAHRQGEEGAWDALSDACRPWLPEPLHAAYFGEDAVPYATALDVGRLLEVGVEDRLRHAADKAKVEEEAAARSWFSVLADFCDAMNTTPQEALDTPFPLFIGLSAEVYRLQERRKADVMLGYAAARSGDEKLWRGILQAAGYERERPQEKAEPGPEWQDEAWVKEQKEKIKRYQQKHFGITPGEA